MMRTLSGVKVLELGSLICTPYCGKLMADLGAEVIKIEAPGQGDIARRYGPFPDACPDNESSGLYLYLNTNKLGITLNLNSVKGRAILHELVKQADVLIEDFTLEQAENLGVHYEALKQANPSIIVTSITPFGQTGPYRQKASSDFTIWNMCGSAYITPRFGGTTEQEPLWVRHMASFITGITAATATMCAVLAKQSTGVGQHVDVSQLESAALSLGPYFAHYFYEHRNTTRASRARYGPIHFVKCKGGWVSLHGVEEHHWKRFVEFLGSPEWAEWEMFSNQYLRAEHWESLEPLITEALTQFTKQEIFEAAKRLNIPVAPVNTIPEVMRERQLEERHFFQSIEHPRAGLLTYPGTGYKYSGMETVAPRPAPLLGQHNCEIYCSRLGYSKEDVVKMLEAGII